MSQPERNPCPCGGGAYEECCSRFIEKGEIPVSAADLMRSRYSAYVLRDERYLLLSWHASTRPHAPIIQEPVKWLGLEVHKHMQEGDAASVEFVARYRDAGGRAHRLHEVSRFVREGGKWYYLDGTFK